MIFNLTQPLISSVPVLGKDFTWSGSDGTCIVIDDGGGNWRIKFLSSGVLTWLKDMLIDAFLVGAGGGGSVAGAGGGYTKTSRLIALIANTEYPITIGAGGTAGSPIAKGGTGGNTSAFEITANGGNGGSALLPSGDGGSGGSGGGNNGGTGGTDGSDGEKSSSGSGSAGKGQGTTTREFGESTGTLYSSGGNGISDGAEAGADNTGDGGDYGKAGGSGIVVIRKHKEAAA